MHIIRLDSLFSRLATDLSLDSRTKRYCLNRINSEGVHFLTSVLPALAKTVLLGIELGSFADARSQLGFTCLAWQGGLLRYFRGYLLRIFKFDGSVLENPCPVALYEIRQLCEYCYKLALPFTDEQLSSAESKFVEVDTEVAKQPFNWDFIDQLRKDLCNFYPRIHNEDFNCVLQKHRPRSGSGTYSTSYLQVEGSPPDYCGPGLVRQKLGQVRKISNIRGFYQRRGTYHVVDGSISGAYKPYPGCPSGLLKLYAYDVGVGPRYLYQPSGIRRLIRRACVRDNKTLNGADVAVRVEPLSEVLFVPKDSRGPRTIVREPYDSLVHQMAFFDWITDALETQSRGRIQFKDQSQNRLLARSGSLSGEWATLDLKDASDRVSFALVQYLFQYTNAPRVFLKRYRTRFALLPSGGFVELGKLAGMGSGFTFPIMSLIIHLAVTRVITDAAKISYKEASNSVYVYGDDIIVPTRYAELCKSALQAVGLQVNAQKSFVNGAFRESCGGDYLNGFEVTPVRLRLQNCDLYASGRKLSVGGSFDTLAIERHCRELVARRLNKTADYLYAVLERTLGPLPIVGGDCPYIGRHSPIPFAYAMKRNGSYVKVRALLTVPSVKRGIQDPYVYLGSKINPTQACWSDALGSSGPQSEYSVYSVPRKVRYVHKRVSAFRLMG